jgi:RNA polymerase sigma factor (sigma-70 family)
MATLTNACDAELLRDYRASRSELAFAQLFARHAPMVQHVALRLLGGKSADADDVAQAVFMSLARSPEDVGIPDRLAGWLHGATVRTARKLVRSRLRRSRNEASAAPRDAVEWDAEAGATDLRCQLDAWLAELPDLLREAVVLCHLEGRSQREAAAIAGCPVGTLGWRASEGIKRLRERSSRQGLADASVATAIAAWPGAPTAPGASAAPLAAPVGHASTVAKAAWLKVAVTAAALVATAGVVVAAAASAAARAHAPLEPPAAPAALDQGAPLQPARGGGPRLALAGIGYLGSVRVPAGRFGAGENAVFDYNDSGLAFDPGRHGLYLKGHAYGQLVAEIGIPSPARIVDGRLEDLPIATVLQGFADVTGGHRDDERIPRGMRIRGLWLDGGGIIGTCVRNDDTDSSQRLGFFTAGPRLDAPACPGLRQVGAPGMSTPMLAAYLCAVPPAWSARLHGTLLCGGTGLGPSIAALDRARLAGADAVTATPLVYYPSEHPALGTWGDPGPNPQYNRTTACTAIVFPAGSRTVLVFGSTGQGRVRDGIGTDDRAMDGKPGPDGVTRVYDPANHAGPCQHAWPYAAYVWAYDADELALVAAGAKHPWEVLPYAAGPVPLPVDSGANAINGAAYDATGGVLYLEQANAEHLGLYSSRPLIHAFRLAQAR